MPRHLSAAAFRLRLAAMAALLVTAVVAVARLPRVPQDPGYHRFADRRSLEGVPNLLDVVSNLPLGAAGIAGLLFAVRKKSQTLGPFSERWERAAWGTLFAAAIATAVGSIYYHWAPDNIRLFWDRLPMALMFMAFLAVMLGERMGMRAGQVLFVPLLAIGAASVIQWRMSEAAGAGDLRFYILVQFFPMLALPLLLALFPPSYSETRGLVAAMSWYVVAKLLEWGDARVFSWGELVSGHTLKHLASAAAVYTLVRTLASRRLLEAA